MQFGILPHDETTSNDFTDLTPAEITEYGNWSDEVNAQVPDSEPEDFRFESWKDWAEWHYTSDEMDAEIRKYKAQDEAYHKRLYQSANFKFNTLHVFSQPDSLTRRGEMLILRRAVTVEQANNGVIDDWRETLTDLFKHGVTVCDASVDSRYNLRIWFLLDVCYGIQQDDKTKRELVQLADGSYVNADPDDVDFLNWISDRGNGGY